MKVTKATAMGTCFGVQDAIDLVLEADEDIRHDLTILGQLVHNPQTVEQLKKAGVKMVDSLDEEITTSHVVITAHGAADKVKNACKDRGFTVIDATCPLVTRVHLCIKKLVRDGYYPVVIGQINHVEVRGIVGDLDEYTVVNSVEEVEVLRDKPRIGIVCQTTQQIKHVEQIVDAIRSQSHEAIKYLDTVCKPTKERQDAVESLSDVVDIMVVIGGHNSSNTKKLKNVCDKKGVQAYHVATLDELDTDWFRQGAHVGITAGTSTPPYVIESFYQRLLKIADELGAA